MGRTATRCVLIALADVLNVLKRICLTVARMLCWRKPAMGEVYELKTEEGDVIVLGTDGLYVGA